MLTFIAIMALVMALMGIFLVYQLEGDLVRRIRDVRDTSKIDLDYLRHDYIQRITNVSEHFATQFQELYIKNQLIELDEMNKELKKQEKVNRGRPKPTPLPLKTIKEGKIIKKPRKKSK